MYPKYPSEATLTNTESPTSANTTYVYRGYTIGSDPILTNNDRPGYFIAPTDEAEVAKQQEEAISFLEQSERQTPDNTNNPEF